MEKPSLEVAGIFHRHGEDYRQTHHLGPQQQKAMEDIEACRTAHLGGHVDSCTQEGCGYTAISYNSCRNRHCPKCQSLKQAKWLNERTERLLPTRYFHMVVTLPHEVIALALFNRKIVFNLLFESASRALLEFSLGYERLRAQVGFTAVLHTWDQDLNFHPHLHIVATGGGLSTDGSKWISATNGFLLPVRALSKIIRAKFAQALEKVYQEGRLKGNAPCLEGKAQFARFTRKLKRKKWVVYCKGLFHGSKKAYDYLSRYTHRVAISNHRLLSLDDHLVTFRARDNRNPGRHRSVTIHAQEFIRRFLLHILPPRFVKIRHFGLMAPCNAKTKLESARTLIINQGPAPGEVPPERTDISKESKTWQEMMEDLTGINPTLCPQCGKGMLVRFKLSSTQHSLSPPIWNSS
ncbi:MAG: IS91 family transposase [Syntrophobacteraceae bacterium]|jgi:hypothetical protein